MFDFIQDETGSQERYWKDRKPSKIAYGFWWVVHNCIAHFLIGICPVKPFFDFHDSTSRKLHMYN